MYWRIHLFGICIRNPPLCEDGFWESTSYWIIQIVLGIHHFLVFPRYLVHPRHFLPDGENIDRSWGMKLHRSSYKTRSTAKGVAGLVVCTRILFPTAVVLKQDPICVWMYIIYIYIQEIVKTMLENIVDDGRKCVCALKSRDRWKPSPPRWPFYA